LQKKSIVSRDLGLSLSLASTGFGESAALCPGKNIRIHWKALDEIYKIQIFLHRSDLKISITFVRIVFCFKNEFSKNSCFLAFFHLYVPEFCDNFQIMEKIQKNHGYVQHCMPIIEEFSS